MQRIHDNISGECTRTTEYRYMVEVLSSRVCLLGGMDRLLMTMYLKNGNTVSQMAKLSGITHSKMSRRIRKLSERLANSEYIVCLRNRSQFTDEELLIAKYYFLHGFSIRQISQEIDYSYYRIRQMLGRIKAILSNDQNTRLKSEQYYN